MRSIEDLQSDLSFTTAATGEERSITFLPDPPRAGRRYTVISADDHIVEAEAPFFARRFPNMRWSILGPRRSAHWDGRALLLGPGMSREAAPAGDALEQLWRTYYASIFNPARTRPRAMRAEMPKKYWHLLPEAAIVRSGIFTTWY